MSIGESMRFVLFCILIISILLMSCQNDNAVRAKMIQVVFTSYAGASAQLQNVRHLAESIRTFGGKYSEAPIRVYCPQVLIDSETVLIEKLGAFNVEVKPVVIPNEASWFYLGGMVFSAAAAEADASGVATVLVFMGSDTIVLQEPEEFILAEGKSLGYRPVFHKNISLLYSEPLDEYWKRVYADMNIKESSIFPMVTPADDDTIRPYFNAACLSVRPEKGLFARWAETFTALNKDSVLMSLCENDFFKRVFTFQVALSGTILNNIARDEMVELSNRINYPIFFKEMYGAKHDFHDITGITTIRYEQFFEKPIPGWDTILTGPADRIAWLKKSFEE